MLHYDAEPVNPAESCLMSFLFPRLVSVPMSGSDRARLMRRRAHWLFLARKVAEVKQHEAAAVLGYANGTSILQLEKGRQDPTAVQMQQLADLYGVPVSMFADPDPTDEERVIAARAELARAAIELAREDHQVEEETPQPSDGRPGETPRRQLA